MQANLIGYLLNALEEDEIRLVEQILEADESAREQLAILRLAFLPLGGDKGHAEPPEALGDRTCDRLRGLRQEQSIQLD